MERGLDFPENGKRKLENGKSTIYILYQASHFSLSISRSWILELFISAR